jgi:hypothetical protein
MNIGPFNTSVFNGVQMEPELEPMRTGKAGGWGMTYHWVSLAVTDKNKYNDIITPAIEWCREQYGKSGSRWYENQRKFYFKDERDMTMFILKWS